MNKAQKDVSNELINFANTFSSFAIIGLFTLAVFYTLHFTADLMIPVCAAILLNLIFSPTVRYLDKLGIKPVFGAAVIVLLLTTTIIGGFYSLSEPVKDWVSRIPDFSQQIDNKVSIIKEPIENVQKASEEVEKITEVENDTNKSQEVVVKKPSLLSRLFGSLRYVAVQLAFILILLYFLLSVGDMFKHKLIKVIPRLKDKMKAERITTQIETSISHYLFTITVINVGLGIAIAAMLYLIEMPNPLLWGIMATLLNFVPYIGSIAGIVIVGTASLITYDSIAQALLAPAVYAALDILEAQLITPAILSQRLTLNPVVVFLAVAFWAWFWGIPGALMAVPLIVIIKIVCDYVEGLHALGEFLSGNQKKSFLRASENWDDPK